MKKAFLLLISLFFISACEIPNSSVNGIEKEVEVSWLWSKNVYYSITDGVVQGTNYEMVNEWINYIDPTNYINNLSYLYPYNSVIDFDTYSWSMIGSMQYSATHTRSDNTLITSSQTITDYSVSFDYIDPETDDTETKTTENTTTEITSIYDESGIIKSTTSVTTGTKNGVPYDSSSEWNMTIEFINDDGDGAIYKVYDSTTDGTQTYMIKRMVDSNMMEQWSYGNGSLTGHFKYLIPLPEKMSSLKILENQTCEILEDSNTKLMLRIKTFDESDILTQQYDQIYLLHEI